MAHTRTQRMMWLAVWLALLAGLGTPGALASMAGEETGLLLSTPTVTPTTGSSVDVTWVGNLNPAGNNPQTIDTISAVPVTVEVYAQGITDPPGQGAGIVCFLQFGQVSAFGSPWLDTVDVPLSYVDDGGDTDRYGINMGPLPAGPYEYTAWCSGNGGVTQVFSDNATSGGNGRLAVSASPPTSTPTSTGVPPAAVTPRPTPTPTRVPAVVINYVRNLNPPGDAPQTIALGGALQVQVDVYARGVTDALGPGPGIICFLHAGQVDAFGGAWSNIVDAPMYFASDVFVEGAPHSDRYAVTWRPEVPGRYEYEAWCSGNAGRTKVWVDTSTSGGSGKLTVTGPPLPPTVPPPSPPPLPGCTELLANGGFEDFGGWQLGLTALVPRYVSTPSPVHAGFRSLAMGSWPPAVPDANSYSSASQQVTIPAGAPAPAISFWYYPISEDAPGGIDYQELLLLDPNRGGETIKILWRVTENSQTWTRSKDYDLSPYRGRTVTVYFNARNDGNGKRTAMYLDDVTLCTGSWTPSPLPTPTATTSPVPPPVTPPPTSTAGPTVVTVTGAPITPRPGSEATVAATAVTGTPPASRLPERTATPTPQPGNQGGESELSRILGTLAPWAILCLIGVIVLITIALLSQILGSRS